MLDTSSLISDIITECTKLSLVQHFKPPTTCSITRCLILSAISKVHNVDSLLDCRLGPTNIDKRKEKFDLSKMNITFRTRRQQKKEISVFELDC